MSVLPMRLPCASNGICWPMATAKPSVETAVDLAFDDHRD
jgi:hypothetical protein